MVYDEDLWDEEIVDSTSKELPGAEIEFFKKEILQNHNWHIDPVDVVYEGRLEECFQVKAINSVGESIRQALQEISDSKKEDKEKGSYQ